MGYGVISVVWLVLAAANLVFGDDPAMTIGLVILSTLNNRWASEEANR